MIAIGVRWGLYSSGAGQGTGARPVGAVEVSHPANQDFVQAFSVYIDTLSVCTATALMILMTGMYNVSEGEGGLITDNGVYVTNAEGEKDVSGTTAFTQGGIDAAFRGQSTFDENFAGFGSCFTAFALLFFCCTTILAYYYMAETNLVYLTKGRHSRLKIVPGIVLISFVFIGSVSTASMARDIADIGVGTMAWLNLIAILIFQKPALMTLRNCERQKKEKDSGKYAIYRPVPEEVKNAGFWHHDYPECLGQENYQYPGEEIPIRDDENPKQ